ncbi:phage repressor protein C with HTH and peptisase S24 domain [Constrictibacter sp. MBR-5]|jgi:phage repressor protein C with HTH and peptisase S24 domain|uniref:S24 family peptidase n=1 Tax=Constrictibacter sp. MBR-5 TaxID=3156467 RepID=UPI003396F61C
MKTPSRFGDAPRAEPYLQLGAAAQSWPLDVGVRFAALLDLFDSPAEAAEIAEVPADQLAAHARGRGAPSFVVVARLAAAAGVDLNWLWSGEGEMMRPEPPAETAPEEDEPPPESLDGEILAAAALADYAVPPLVDRGGDGGADAPPADWPQATDAVAFRTSWLAERLGCGADDIVLFTVAGDEMEPTLRAGDLALCDRRDAGVGQGGLYAFAVDDRIVVRRVQHRFDGAVLLLSDDPHYQAEALHPQDAARLHVLGRIVWHGRSL